MRNMILLDIETMDFGVESGIYEVALIVIQDREVVLTEHIAEVKDEALIHLGMGEGYADISEDEFQKNRFRNIIHKYDYPVVAHNVSFDRKFLVHYGWLDEDHQCFDSARAIKYANPDLFSYSLGYLLSFYDIERPLTHIALDDVKALHEVIIKANPGSWIPLYKASPRKLKSLVKATANVEGQSTIFEGKRMVFTGESPFPRVLMKEMAAKCGAVVTGNVSSKTDLLVCGDKPGSKLDKAREAGVEIQTDEWFIDAVSQDLNLDTASVTRESIAVSTDSYVEKPENKYTEVPELKGKSVNIALLPFRIQTKVEDILVDHMEVAKINKGSNGYNVDIVIHSEGKDYVMLEKAKELKIKTIPLSKFNQMILSSFD
ncbi:BRCT domain-containing protein [Salicibibacter halophilus]|nr:BRCT domain-containing protein [Salicibibacter halophilus]